MKRLILRKASSGRVPTLHVKDVLLSWAPQSGQFFHAIASTTDPVSRGIDNGVLFWGGGSTKVAIFQQDKDSSCVGLLHSA